MGHFLVHDSVHTFSPQPSARLPSEWFLSCYLSAYLTQKPTNERASKQKEKNPSLALQFLYWPGNASRAPHPHTHTHTKTRCCIICYITHTSSPARKASKGRCMGCKESCVCGCVSVCVRASRSTGGCDVREGGENIHCMRKGMMTFMCSLHEQSLDCCMCRSSTRSENKKSKGNCTRLYFTNSIAFFFQCEFRGIHLKKCIMSQIICIVAEKQTSNRRKNLFFYTWICAFSCKQIQLVLIILSLTLSSCISNVCCVSCASTLSATANFSVPLKWSNVDCL